MISSLLLSTLTILYINTEHKDEMMVYFKYSLLKVTLYIGLIVGIDPA